jgi:hypothetical protein
VEQFDFVVQIVYLEKTKQMRKHILLRAKFLSILLAVLAFANKLLAQPIEIVDTKNEYVLSGSFCVTINNHTDSTALFSIALEQAKDNQWREVWSDVFNYTDAESKMARVFKIDRNGATTKCFYPGRFFKTADKYEYRLHVHGFTFHQVEYEPIYSKPFRFTNK